MILSGVPAEERDRLLALSEEELANEGCTLESVTRFSGPLLGHPSQQMNRIGLGRHVVI